MKLIKFRGKRKTKTWKHANVDGKDNGKQEQSFDLQESGKSRRISTAWNTVRRKLSSKKKIEKGLSSADECRHSFVVSDASPLTEFICRAISIATCYIEKSVEEGQASSVNRLYHPQYLNPNSSREHQIRICEIMIREGRNGNIHVEDFAIFSDVHVVTFSVAYF